MAILAVLVALVPAPLHAAAPPLRTSEAVGAPPTPAESWRQPGLRLQIRLGPELLRGLGRQPPPDSAAVAVALAPSLRLTRHWSLALGMQYVRLLDIPASALTGLRYSITLGPLLHLGPFALGVGGGLAGIIGDWRPPATGAPYDPPSGSCDGSGGHAHLQLDYHLAVGDNFATGPLLQGEVQGIRCQHGPTWWHASAALLWDLAWR